LHSRCDGRPSSCPADGRPSSSGETTRATHPRCREAHPGVDRPPRRLGSGCAALPRLGCDRACRGQATPLRAIRDCVLRRTECVCQVAQRDALGPNTFSEKLHRSARRTHHVFRAHRSTPQQQDPVRSWQAVRSRADWASPQLPKHRGTRVFTAQCEWRVGKHRTKVPREREARYSTMNASQDRAARGR